MADDWPGHYPSLSLRLLVRRDRASERKQRLFAVACCRHRYDLLGRGVSRELVAVAERFADGLATASDLEAVRSGFAEGDFRGAAHAAGLAAVAAANADIGGLWGAVHTSDQMIEAAARQAAEAAHRKAEMSGGRGDMASEAARRARATAEAEERREQLTLLRDLFGDPSGPALVIGPGVLAWNGGTPARLALVAYENRFLPSGQLDPARLGVLADALEEAGADGEIVGHLRGSGPHVRGCRVVDLVLGKT